MSGTKGDFAAKCNVVEMVTNPDQSITAVSLDGGAMMQLSLNGGTAQTLGITINKSKSIGGMWFSSNWDGVKTVDKQVNNWASQPIQVHN